MSGGFIKPQKDGEHQLVIFTFIGHIPASKVAKWNDNLASIKKLFGANLAGITTQGDPTPARYRPKKKKR